MVGRPRLKPRYVLGHHQGCKSTSLLVSIVNLISSGYGYLTRSDVETAVNGYRQAQIPLDTMHIDVDFQV